MTIVYHFEQRSNEQFFHDIPIDVTLLANNNAEEVVSHLYVTEAYYFNPKQVRREQLVRLVNMLQQNLPADSQQNTQPQWNQQQPRSNQINIQDNAYQGNLNSQNQPAENLNPGRRKNFFERKRFINYEDKGGNENAEAPDGAQGKNNSPGQDKRGQNSNALHARRRFDELKTQNKGRDHSPQPDLPGLDQMPKLHTQ